MKTTFKDIAHHYLGTGLTVKNLYNNRTEIVAGIDRDKICLYEQHPSMTFQYDFDEVLPRFRPLSSLMQEIEPGVIGLVDFLKPEINLTGQKIERIGNMFYARDAFGNAPVFHFHESTSLPFPKWQWLLRHHFNCFSLDESEFIAI